MTTRGSGEEIKMAGLSLTGKVGKVLTYSIVLISPAKMDNSLLLIRESVFQELWEHQKLTNW